jgi:dUTP pyrophosphatase
MKPPQVKIKLLTHSALVPVKKSSDAAAYDLFSIETIGLPPNKVTAVKTGVALEIPKGWKGEIYSRSGLALKGLVVANQPGKIDSDYRGPIQILLHNWTSSYIALTRGDRIAQLEINPVYDVDFVEVDELSKTDRGDGGLGSTGK